MITIRSAIKIVSLETAALKSERVDISESLGRILAQDVVADMDLPPFDRSQMDGYAAIATDTTKAPVELTIIGESAAGSGFDRKLKSGEYRLYSRKVNPKTGKRRNLGTFKSRAAAEKHEREVQYFKRH